MSPGPSGPVALTVFAAASLRDALEGVRAVYPAARPGTTLTISTGSSPALATQVEQGAPADVFLSADAASAERLVAAGVAAGDPIAFAANRLAIIVPVHNPAAIRSPADLALDGTKVVAAADGVPITRYADVLVANLAGEPGYPTDYAARYEANVVSREVDVRAVVAKIELGEGDAAIVYATDAAASSRVATIEVPEAANVAAGYAGVVVKASIHQAEASAFLEWLAGPGGQAILADYGFQPPPAG